MNNVNTQLLDFVCQQPPFNLLEKDELKFIEGALEMVEYPGGTYLLVQDGEPSGYLNVIYKGSVRLVKDGQLLQVLERGAMFGYLSLLSQQSAFFDAVAEEALVVARISKEVFHTLTNNQAFAEFFLRNLSEHCRSVARLVGAENGTLGGDLTSLVGDLIQRPPIIVEPQTSLYETSVAMREDFVDAALVNAEPMGIVTDRDFLIRGMAEKRGPDTPVELVMSQPVRSLAADTPVYLALLYMLEHQVHHLALTHEDEMVGLVSADDLLRNQAQHPLYFIRQLERSADLKRTLSRYALNVAGTVEMLQKGGLDVAQIGRVVANLNGTLLKRLLDLVEEELGPAPCPYAWIVFGSEGRMEQLLLTDQDNGLVYRDDTEQARSYFEALAKRVVDGLIQAGVPPCPGGYMATNWCRPLADWVAMFERWVTSPDPLALMEACVFFDFRVVHGELSLAPLEKILFESGDRSIYMAQMSKMATEFPPPLTMLRRIREKDGQVDIKKGGVAAIVATARFFALEAGVRDRSTFARLEGACAAGKLSRDGADTLADAYRFMLKLRLRQQLIKIKLGDAPDNNITLQSLSSIKKRRLKEAFTAIREIQDFISQRF